MDITVVINTFQRSEKAIVCLRSILKNDFKNYQIIVIDQGKGEELERLIEHLMRKELSTLILKI